MTRRVCTALEYAQNVMLFKVFGQVHWCGGGWDAHPHIHQGPCSNELLHNSLVS